MLWEVKLCDCVGGKFYGLFKCGFVVDLCFEDVMVGWNVGEVEVVGGIG